MEEQKVTTHQTSTIQDSKGEDIQKTQINSGISVHNLFKYWKLWVAVLGLVVLIVIIVVSINAVNVYRNASTYKKTYDQVMEEIKACEKLEKISQPRDTFVYCDRFLSKFRENNGK